MKKYNNDYKSEYSKKLLDPRWQRKRLEILNRDNFCCQMCNDSTSTLHVHHRYYVSGNEPWEYENNILVTYCEACHAHETELISSTIRNMVEVMHKAGANSFDFISLSSVIENFNNDASKFFSFTHHLMRHPEVFDTLLESLYSEIERIETKENEVSND